ncbi:hypothetical protein KIW84_045871 [Lathyrus oleraceus]|uniref:Reverse transcriptase/retrotransposon-derived protein RNase H-like domain-containing protein n=1 Tax=Pisum sativum TaxID=3888 RepID=A0A9D4XLB1_PEA|nr:hypothetical protein KIW84_045871 [Pisum sativum]
MTMGSKESFKEYAQKWRDLAGKVKPPMIDRELVDMFMGTLTGPFYIHLLGSSSSSFTELILTGEHVENDIRSGKIQAATSASTKMSYQGKNESNVVYGQRGHNKKNRDHTVGAVTIAAPPSQNFQHRQDRPRRQFTKINMTLAQALQGMLKANLITLRDPPANPNTTSPRYNPNARCAYHSDSPGYDTNDCWLLKNKIQDMINAGEIDFDPPETPNVITAPLPNHDKTVNVVEDVDSDCDLDSWIFPTIGDGLNNWKAEDTIPISFSQESISTLDPVDNNSATVNYGFENPIYQAEDGSEEDCEVPGELARLLLQEEKTIQPHEESIEIVNLRTEVDKKEVRAFDKIKKYLQEPPVLMPPVEGRPLIMYLTVLEDSMGCVLGQHDESGRKEHAIYHLSKKFTDCETRYSLLEKTCCALAWAARRLRQYMSNHTTLLISKMDPIKYIFEKPALS